MDPLQALLDEYPYVLADGAMGTMLMNAGLSTAIARRWNVGTLTRPRRPRGVYQRGLADCSDEHGGSPFRLKLHKLDDRVAELNRAGAEIARNAADATGRRVVVAGRWGRRGADRAAGHAQR